MTAPPFPVVRCDGCHFVTPGMFTGGLSTPRVNEEQRLMDLKAEGWLITDQRDLCPRCNERERG